jgi:hypothetical protein
VTAGAPLSTWTKASIISDILSPSPVIHGTNHAVKASDEFPAQVSGEKQSLEWNKESSRQTQCNLEALGAGQIAE